MRAHWGFAIVGTGCILAAFVTQILTLSWRNWIILEVHDSNNTKNIEIGLWGACFRGEGCYAYHGDALPWHLQVSIFTAMTIICFVTLIFAFSTVEMLYIWSYRSSFPLKKPQIYLSAVAVLLSIFLVIIMAMMVVSGSEETVWKVFRIKWLTKEPSTLGGPVRFAVSQGWGHQVLTTVYLATYIFVIYCHMKQIHGERRNPLLENNQHENPRRLRISVVISPAGSQRSAEVVERTPPPAYSPPPAYGDPEETANETRPLTAETIHSGSLLFNVY